MPLTLSGFTAPAEEVTPRPLGCPVYEDQHVQEAVEQPSKWPGIALLVTGVSLALGAWLLRKAPANHSADAPTLGKHGVEVPDARGGGSLVHPSGGQHGGGVADQ